MLTGPAAARLARSNQVEGVELKWVPPRWGPNKHTPASPTRWLPRRRDINASGLAHNTTHSMGDHTVAVLKFEIQSARRFKQSGSKKRASFQTVIAVSGERSTLPRYFWENRFTHFASGVLTLVLAGAGTRDPAQSKELDVGSKFAVLASKMLTRRAAAHLARPNQVERVELNISVRNLNWYIQSDT